MADTTPQQHAEALEQALAALPPELNALGIYNFYAWTSYVHAANPDAIRSLLDERKRLTSAIEKYEADDVRYMAERKRLREALERIAGFDPYNSDGMRTIAREALK